MGEVRRSNTVKTTFHVSGTQNVKTEETIKLPKIMPAESEGNFIIQNNESKENIFVTKH